ncbi:MAG: MFS transporter [Actinomycetes bacterium]
MNDPARRAARRTGRRASRSPRRPVRCLSKGCRCGGGRATRGNESTMTWHESLAPLRSRDFAWYFWSRVSDTLGTMMASLALTFAVLDIEDSATAVGIVLAARTIPLVAFLLLGGVIADRVSRSALLQTSNLAAALTQAVLAALVITGTAELWMVIVLAALNGTVDAVSFPAQQSLVPQLVERGQIQSANVLMSMSRAALSIVAPSLAALLVVTIGPGWALAVNAATWLLSAVLLLPVRVPALVAAEDRSSTIADLREGWVLFKGTTWLWVIVLAFSVLNAIHSGAWFTVGPVVAKDTIGEQGWGLVLSAGSVGLLVMTIILLRVRLRRPLLTGMLGISLLGLPIVVLGAEPNLTALLVASFVAGAGIEVFSIGWNVAMQENIDEQMLSRAYSYDALGSFAAMPVGQLVYGPLAGAFGHREVLVWSGVAYAVIAVLALTSRSVRTLDRVSLGLPGDRDVASPASGGGA